MLSVVLAQIGAQAQSPTIQDFEGIFFNIVSSVIGLSAIVLLVVLVFGGFQYITAGSEPGKVEGARKTLTYGILGIVIILTSYLIIQIISFALGLESSLNPLTRFRVFIQ